jgi:hypothetical protein
MFIVGSVYLRFYIEVGVGTYLPTPTRNILTDSDSVGTFLPTPTPPNIPSESTTSTPTPQPWVGTLSDHRT